MQKIILLILLFSPLAVNCHTLDKDSILHTIDEAIVYFDNYDYVNARNILLSFPTSNLSRIDDKDKFRYYAYLTMAYYGSEDIEEAINTGNIALSLANTGGNKTFLYVQFLNGLGPACIDNGNYQEAIHYLEEAESLYRQLFWGKEDNEYLEIVTNLSEAYNYNDEMSKAMDWAVCAMSVARDCFGEKSSLYGDASINYMAILNEYGRFSESVSVGEKTKENLLSIGEQGEDCLSKCYYYLAYTYIEMGKPQKALEYAEKALSLETKLRSENSLRYYTITNMIALCYSDLWDVQKAIEISEKSLKKQESEFGLNSHICTLLNNLSRYYEKIGNYNKSIEYRILDKEIQEKEHIDNTPDYIISLMNISKTYSGIQDTTNAVIYANRSIYLSDSLNLDRLKFETRYNMAKLYYDNYNHVYAKKILCKLIDSLSDTQLFKTRLKVLSLLACIELKEKNYEQAFNVSASGIQTMTLCKDYSLLLPYLSILSECSYQQKKINLYENLLHIQLNLIFKRNSNILSKLSSDQRWLFWGSGLLANFDNLLANINDYGSISRLSALGLNTVINSKGLLLSHDRQEHQISETDYEDILSLYCQKIMCCVNNECNISDSDISKIDIQNGLLFDWHSIKSKLQKNEIVVEYAKFVRDTVNSYMAFVFDNKSVYPDVYYAGTENDIISNYKSGTLYDLLWSPILKKYSCDSIRTVYFSPDGILHTLGIEYLSDVHGNYICDTYDMYRLSSSRELLKENHSQVSKQSVIYGGLDYSYSSTETAICHPEQNVVIPEYYRGLFTDISERSGFEYLPYSLSEAQEIYNIFIDGGYNCSLYAGNRGTEDSFKKMSGKDVNIIHLATHGMYIESLNNMQKRNLDVLLSSYSFEDNLLCRSFIVMAKGNALPTFKKTPYGEDDGILTALEISKIDLKKCGLLVLSSCQSGEGAITSDGVVGLQRGFKKAGVGSILMTLGNIEDKYTKFFMVEFYRNLCHGFSKHESFKRAQNLVRSTNEDKVDSMAWKKYVLLDAIY